jgi:hypothetical protein
MFTLEQLRNLKVFLSRTTMKAGEAQIYVDLTRKIDQNIAKENHKEVKKKKEENKKALEESKDEN